MNRLIVAAAATLATLASLPAAAQFQKPEDAIKYRQSVMTVQANHLGRIGAMAQGRVPFDAGVAAANAQVVATMSRLPWVAFGDGTDKGRPTRAKPEIWKEQAKFKDLQGKLVGEAEKLEAAAKSGNLDSIKAAVGEIGKVCKACHDDFQAEKYSAN